MKSLRRVLSWMAWVAVHAVVLAGAWLVSSALTAGPRVALGIDTPLAWPAVGVLALGIAGPWLAAAHRRSSRPRARLVTTISGLAGYGAAGVLAWLAVQANPEEPIPSMAWGSLAIALGLQVVPLASRLPRWRQVLSLALGLGAAALTLWLVRDWAPGHEDEVRAAARWVSSPHHRTLVALMGAGLVLACLYWLVGLADIRRRRAWLWALVAGVAAGPAAWGTLAILQRPPEGLARIVAEDAGFADPQGPFADTGAKGILGWRWVRSGLVWREALLVQPPCRLRQPTTLPADGRLRLFLSLPRQVLLEQDRSVRVHCVLRDESGRQLSEAWCDLFASSVREPVAAWRDATLAAGDWAGRRVELEVAAEGIGSDLKGAHLPVLAIAAAPATGRGGPTTSSPAGPSCLVILVDALRSDRLHCYGYPLETSPSIDRLAAEGTLFERTVSAASWTVPSVASLFTGTYVATHGMTDWRVPQRMPLPTVAEAFREAGARTAAVSANTMAFPAAGYGRGFDLFIGAHVFEEDPFHRGAWVTDQAIALLKEFQGERFFLYLHYMDPHYPYRPPPDYAKFGRTAQERYLGLILYCDHEVGRLLAALDALGRRDDTLVVLLADHGEAFQEHGFWDHGETLHREEIQVPLVLRLPGRLPGGRRVRTQVRSIDIHATIYDLAGLPLPRHAEGESLVSLISSDDVVADRPAFTQTGFMEDGASCPVQVGLEDGRYKLILYVDEDRRLLYDVRADPEERKDLAADRPDLADAMEREIRKFLKSRKGTSAGRRPLTPEQRERLKAIGYFTGGDR